MNARIIHGTANSFCLAQFYSEQIGAIAEEHYTPVKTILQIFGGRLPLAIKSVQTCQRRALGLWVAHTVFLGGFL